MDSPVFRALQEDEGDDDDGGGRGGIEPNFDDPVFLGLVAGGGSLVFLTCMGITSSFNRTSE